MSEEIRDTLKQRGTRYGTLAANGSISQHFKLVARQGLFDHSKDGVLVTSTSWDNMSDDQRQDLDVIFDKISRILTGDPHYDDNWRDIAGYATLVLDNLTKESSQ